MSNAASPGRTCELYALAFQSPLSLAEILARLGTATPWDWAARASEDYGDHLVCRALPSPHVAYVKVFREGGGYAINVKLECDGPEADLLAASLRAVVVDTVLPALLATEVWPTLYYD